MQTEAELIADLRAHPGQTIRLVEVVVAGQSQEPPADQARSRKVVLVKDEAIVLEDGKQMPLGCMASYEYDRENSRFHALIGAARLTYEIARGHA